MLHAIMCEEGSKSRRIREVHDEGARGLEKLEILVGWSALGYNLLGPFGLVAESIAHESPELRIRRE
jgi:hypothetical protein